MKPRTAGFVGGFVVALVLVAAVTLGVRASDAARGDGKPPSTGPAAIAKALDSAVGQAGVVHACRASGRVYVCGADTGGQVVAYRVAVTNGGRCWNAEATDASWKKWQDQPDANKPGTVDATYNGWLHNRADCDPEYVTAQKAAEFRQELKDKAAKLHPAKRSANCRPGYSVCIPPDVGDVDCGELGATDIQVTGDDPYGLDADGDGIGCES